MKHTVLDKGVFKRVDKLDDDHLSFDGTRNIFSMPSNLITGISSCSGGRILLGAKASLQSIPLTHRERALVESCDSEDKESTQEKFGKHYLSITAIKPGKVTEITKDNIKVKNDDGTEHNYDLYHNFNLGRKSFISHEAQVKLGQQIKANQILATSNFTDKHGNMAIGVNLKTAIMPFRGSNFEDAYAVSESGARKLEAEQMIKFHIEKKFGIEVDKHKFISLFPNKYTNNQIVNIDQDGVIKTETIVHNGDPIILAFSPRAIKSTDLALGKLSKVLKHAFKDNSQIWDYEHDGEVVEVAKHGDLITVHIKTKRSLLAGDKISGVFGAKGVCSIIEDSQAPVCEDGKPIDVILNSMSITSRVAPALAITLGLGKLAEKTGKVIKMDQFRKDSSIQNIVDILKKHKINDVENLYDPVTGKNIEAVVGPLFYNRLVHVSEDKLSTRSQGEGYSFNFQPTKIEGNSSKRIGNLGTTALLAHNAKHVLEDLGTVRGTKNDEFWRALKLGQPTPTPKVPFIFNKFIASLQGAGVNVSRTDNKFNILPLTDKDVLKLSNGAISKPSMFKAHQDELIPEAGGLFDPDNIGVMGDKFNHINLNTTVPNPISEDYLRKLLKVTKEGFNDLVVSGDIVKKLEGINLDNKINEMKKYIISAKKSERDNSIKILEFLTALKAHNLHPKDLLLTKIPVLPAQYRPASKVGNVLLTSDVNNLYKDLISNNNALKNTENVPSEIVNKLKDNQYKAVKAVFGLGDPINKKNKDKHVKGILATTLGLGGGTAKSTMFQSNVVNKSLDLVGRAVLGPDTKLDVDQASVPQELLWQVYKPFIIKRLVVKGVPVIKAMDYVKKHNPLAIEALREELLVRPGIVTRDPAWHKFNLMGFHLKPNAKANDNTIKLNPLVFKGFGADSVIDHIIYREKLTS